MLTNQRDVAEAFRATLPFRVAVIAVLVFTNISGSVHAQRRRPPVRPDRPIVRTERPSEDPDGPHHARKLLRETPLVRIHLGHRFGRPSCSATLADVVMVFKVGDDYRIENNESYWRLIDEEVAPAVSAECGGVRVIRIENYVDGYRLASARGGALRVYRTDEPFMTKREQTGILNLDGEAAEAPINTAALTLASAAGPRRSFSSINERDPTQAAPVSIVQMRAESERYTQLTSQLASERRERQAAQLAESAEMKRWSYRHGQGFILSDAQRRRQAAAAEMVKDKGALLANAWGMVTEAGQALYEGKRFDPTGPLDMVTALLVVGIGDLIRAADRVLATIPGWTSGRLQTSSALPPSLAEDTFARDIFVGSFAEVLGEEPVSPVVPVHRRTSQNDLTVGFLAYHLAYGRSCKTDRTSEWIDLPYEDAIVTTNRVTGLETGHQSVKTTIYPVRAPYVALFRGSMASKLTWSLLEQVTLNFDLAHRRDVFSSWFAAGGCQGDVTRQFEVNLFLASEGFPPLQRLLQMPPQ